MKVLSETEKSKYFIIFLLCLSPFVFLFYQARYSEEIEFLFPSSEADWILHPGDSIKGTARFRRKFIVGRVPAACQLQLRAMRQLQINVNHKFAGRAPEDHNWKFPVKFDIAPHLKSGENVITVDVTNQAGPAALLVEADSIETENAKVDLDTDDKWQVTLEPTSENWTTPIVSLKEGAHLESKPGPIQKSKNYPIYMMLFGAYCLIILLATNPLHIFIRRKQIKFDYPPIQPQSSPKKLTARIATFIESRGTSLFVRKDYLLILIGVVILVVNVHNTVNYKYARACFDWGGHVEYIKYVASKWRTPVATEGWEMFQPPLYYFLSAFIYRIFGGEAAEPNSLKAVQFFGTFSGIATAFFALCILRRLFPQNRAIQAMGLSLVGLMPMCLYMNPLISNEVFAGTMISLSIALLVRYGFTEQILLKHYLIMAGAIGLALLSKYTAIFIFITATIVFGIRMLDKLHRKQELRSFLIFLAVVFVICGWLYARNLVMFGDPFIGNWDEESTYHYEQAPGYRTLGFYSRFGSVFFHIPERSRWASFWDGQYGSLWGDSHGNFLKIDDDRANKLGMIIIYLALLPTVAILLGFFQSLKKLFRSWRSEPDLALVMVSVLTITSLVSFTMEVPFYSTIKAFFFLSLLPAIAVFGGKGLYTMCQNIGRFRYIVYCNLLVLYLLIVNLFWYQGT